MLVFSAVKNRLDSPSAFSEQVCGKTYSRNIQLNNIYFLKNIFPLSLNILNKPVGLKIFGHI